MATPTTFWRLAGMSYTQYVTRAATALRNGLKEPAKSQALKNETFSYNAAAWEAGQSTGKKPVTKLAEAGL
ncbi:hypothetical protein CTEN210_01267 [Chaetoceros tenuissimus]|uniref:Uncharacterized protein n=1 Tax=Chaetoceros tenuissimus TaxID=426638 RepID=A0AAD3GZQ8_9STRA|nr:hypothetical protein CTEN210_01267 [Chaetoceros tenuissimus]